MLELSSVPPQTTVLLCYPNRLSQVEHVATVYYGITMVYADYIYRQLGLQINHVSTSYKLRQLWLISLLRSESNSYPTSYIDRRQKNS